MDRVGPSPQGIGLWIWRVIKTIVYDVTIVFIMNLVDVVMKMCDENEMKR